MEQFLHFSSEGQSFIVPLRSVYRVINWTPPKPLPFVPPYIMGILHFEGALWVGVDLDAILGRTPSDSGGELILVRQGEAHLAFRSRRTQDIVQIPPERRDKRSLPGIPDSCVAFITVIGPEMVCALDLASFVEEFQVR